MSGRSGSFRAAKLFTFAGVFAQLSFSILKIKIIAMNKDLSACFLVIGTLLISCQSQKNCKYKPAPVFEAGLPHIVQYNFEVQGQQSLESLLLDTNVLLEISQDVCTETRQEYRFKVQGDYSRYPDSLWLKEATRQLVFLSSFSPKQAPLKAWADVIEIRRGEMKLGEDREVEQGVFVRVDRVVSPDQSTLMLVFSQKDGGR